MKHLILTICVVIGIITLCERAQATSDTLQPAFSLGNFEIDPGSGPTPGIGDTLELELSFMSHIDGAARVRIHFPGSLAPPNQGVGETMRDSIVSLDSGNIYTITIPIEVFALGSSMLQASVESMGILPNLAPMSIFGALQIEHSNSLFRVLGTGNVFHETRTTQVEVITPAPVPAHCSISGNVLYYDGAQSLYKGAYGAYAILLFRKPSGLPGGSVPCSFVSGIQPTLYHPNEGWIEGVHYSKIDADGSFSFDFYAPMGYWNRYIDAEVYVTNWSEAVYLMNHHQASLGISADSTGGVSLFVWSGTEFPGSMTDPPSALSTYRNAYSWCGATGSGNTLTYSGIEIILDSYDGSFFRNFQFCREFDLARFGDVPPRIKTTLSSNYNFSGVAFIDQLLIAKPSVSTYRLPTIGHEYGHMYLYYKQGQWSGTNEFDFQEAFGDFHSFAVQNWVPGEYGDIPYWWEPEKGNLENRWSFNPRYTGPGYQDVPKAGPASFMWSVYDTYFPSEYEYLPIGEGDNDDVGEPELLVSLINAGSSTATDLLESLKEELSPSWPIESEKALSIQAMYDCFMDPDVNPPSFAPMLPPQITNLQGNLVDLFPTYELTWDQQTYPGGAPAWFNVPTGIKIYQYDAIFGWVAADDIAGDETSVEIMFGDNDFIVTAYNSTGESSDAEMIVDVMKPSVEGETMGPQLEIQLQVTPNPVINGAGRVRLSGDFSDIQGTLLLISSTGQTMRVIHEGKLDSNSEFEVSFSDLSAGTYFVTLDALGRKFFTKVKI